MNNKKTTVTIGIPAYNEESNIKLLIDSLLSQERKNYVLQKILVISDKSSDNTEKIVESYRLKEVQLLKNRTRMGQALSQNKLMENSTSEVLVLLNADVLPTDKKCIDNLIKPIIQNPNVGIVGGKPIPVTAETFIEKIINFSVFFKNDMYEASRDGRNIYLCHGRIRALSKRFYKNFKWPSLISEDAYSYLACISRNQEFYYVQNSNVYYRSPQTFKDHLKQSGRFLNSAKEMKKFFSADFVNAQYELSRLLMIRKFAKHLLLNSFYMTLYLIIIVISKLVSAVRFERPTWSSSSSTKTLSI